jgi:hypothetical protein
LGISSDIPANLSTLHEQEESLRAKAIGLIEANADLSLHLAVVESVMTFCETMRQIATENQDERTLQLLCLRVFNTFASSVKLLLSGYSQVAASIARDAMETIFLLDMLTTDPALISQWRNAKSGREKDSFKPVEVRKYIDKRDELTGKKREAHYKAFSELAAHPSPISHLMLRPNPSSLALIGPFIEESTLSVVLAELGQFAIQFAGLSTRIMCAEPMLTQTTTGYSKLWNSWYRTFMIDENAAHKPPRVEQ